VKKKEQGYTCTPLWAFVACSGVNFTFTFRSTLVSCGRFLEKKNIKLQVI
jgi:hypothetical protein